MIDLKWLIIILVMAVIMFYLMSISCGNTDTRYLPMKRTTDYLRECAR